MYSFGEKSVGINVSWVVEFEKWWVLKRKIFGQESTYSKAFFLKKWSVNYALSKSAKIVLTKPMFRVTN